MLWVVYLCVANEMNECCHDLSLALSAEKTGNFDDALTWTEPILHVDMDSFFVEVERRLAPSLLGRPVAVGGKGPRGVIASASYEARAFGVHSAQPTATALRRCPHLVVLPPTHGRYREASSEVFAVFRSFTPLVEGLSLDEAFLDVTGLRRHFDSPADVGERVRAEIRANLGLPSSVGVASSKFLAKLASQEAKPDGLFHLAKDRELEYLHALPARALWGVGPATLAGLERLGVETVGDIASLPESTLMGAIGPTHGHHLHMLANAIDPRPVDPDSEAKSISVEETYDSDIVGIEVIETALLAHAQKLSWRLHRAGLTARTITLKARYGDFTTITRSQTLAGPVDGARELFKAAHPLLGHLNPDRPVRLLGLGASSFEPADRPRQLGLDTSEEWTRVEEAIAAVRDRFGEQAVSPARLLDEGR